MCIFCEIAAGRIPGKVVYEDEDVIAILDLSQVTLGHTLVMPKQHTANIIEADEDTAVKCMKVVHKLSRQIVKNTGAAGCNILNNCGTAAGQTVEHLHFHIIPRYSEEDSVSIEFGSNQLDLDEVLAKVKG